MATSTASKINSLEKHLTKLKACKLCPKMIGPVVTPGPVASKVYLIGQAPGPREGIFGKPFAWTAGKTLFRWFSTIGLEEESFRKKVYMSAVCRCFPGKTKQKSDRVPSPDEIQNCSLWMKEEIDILKPELVIPVGRLAIEQIFGPRQLVDIIGKKFTMEMFDHECDVIALPHPSGASSWYKVEPGKTLLHKGLALINKHPAWKKIRE